MIPVLIFIALLIMLAGVYCWRGQHCPGDSDRQRQVIEVCLSLLQVIQEAQRHRGLSIAILNGEKDFNEEVFTTEKVIQQSLSNMGEYYAAHYRVFSRDQWKAIIYKWKSLRASWRDLDFISNLFAHNELIIEMIDVLQQLAKEEHQRLGRERAQLISHWPQFIEHLGMLRALGVYALSQTSAASVMNISLTLADHKQQAKQVLSHETVVIDDQLLIQNSEHALRQVDKLIMVGGTEQPLNTGHTVKSFYQDMTSLIDSWYLLLQQRMHV